MRSRWGTGVQAWAVPICIDFHGTDGTLFVDRGGFGRDFEATSVHEQRAVRTVEIDAAALVVERRRVRQPVLVGEIGRASGRERGETSGVAGSLKNKKSR